MLTISKQEAITALTRLGEIAAAQGETIELLLVGGGAMVLLFDARDSTKDLDVAIISPADAARTRGLAREVATELSLPEDWLNDAAKGFLVGNSVGREAFASTGITVRTPATEQLLARKLCAWRDDVDIADARRLLIEITGDYNSTWQKLCRTCFPARNWQPSMRLMTFGSPSMVTIESLARAALAGEGLQVARLRRNGCGKTSNLIGCHALKVETRM